MRIELVVPNRELGQTLHPQPRAIAVVPSWRRVKVKLPFHLDLCDAPKVLLEDVGFDRELVFVVRVLIVAPAAALEIPALRLDPVL